MMDGRKRIWGAQLLPTGGASFRLWAPGLETLRLRHNGADHEMERQEAGWFEKIVPDSAPDAAYAFVLPDGLVVPDPAASAQVDDVHGASRLIGHDLYQWANAAWKGRPLAEALYYELHVGTFTPQGTFRAAIEHLPHLADLGITVIELMPVAHFAGGRGWGYDGVLPYAPHNAYGTPDDLKALVDAAHGLGLMVVLDVVYNHFGPDGNYLGVYAPDFFHPERHTPWGAAIAYEKEPVRRFFIENALFWLETYRFDGLRLDAIDHIRDTGSDADILVELAQEVRAKLPDRHIHLTTEDNRNITTLHERDGDGSVPLFSAEWNDDFHNVAHVIATGETEGYYRDFASGHWQKFARALAEGFAYQGENSDYGGAPRGQASAHLPPTAFVDFLQNHDQTGNRAFGERLLTLAPARTVRALTAILLLSPHIPLLFMGEEWGEHRPFCFFTDFHGELADAVREGRRREFADFSAFHHDRAALEHIPDPNALSTFEASRIDWAARETEDGKAWLDFVRGLIALRRSHIVPLLSQAGANAGKIVAVEEGALAVDWRLGPAILELRADFSGESDTLPKANGRPIFTLGDDDAGAAPPRILFALHETEGD